MGTYGLADGVLAADAGGAASCPPELVPKI